MGKNWIIWCCLISLVFLGCLSGKVQNPTLSVWATGDSLKIKPHDPEEWYRARDMIGEMIDAKIKNQNKSTKKSNRGIIK